MVKQATVYESSPEWTPADPQPWMDEALCAQSSPDLWFPEGVGNNGGVEAKRICRACPVIAQCAVYAVGLNEKYGIWAGARAGQLRPRMEGERGKR